MLLNRRTGIKVARGRAAVKSEKTLPLEQRTHRKAGSASNKGTVRDAVVKCNHKETRRLEHQSEFFRDRRTVSFRFVGTPQSPVSQSGGNCLETISGLIGEDITTPKFFIPG